MTSNLRLIGSGNTDGRSYYILTKDAAFFARFPRFLLGCGFRDLDVYEDYSESPPDLATLENTIDHLKNDRYDIDIVYTHDRIVLIVRTAEENHAALRVGVASLTEQT